MRKGLDEYLRFNKHKRLHQSLDFRTSSEVYQDKTIAAKMGNILGKMGFNRRLGMGCLRGGMGWLGGRKTEIVNKRMRKKEVK